MVALLTILASASQALGSPLRQLARSTTSFASDGERYAAWQLHAGAPIVVLDTLTGSRQTIAAMAGCELMRDQDEDGEPSATAADGRFLLDCVTPAHVLSGTGAAPAETGRPRARRARGGKRASHQRRTPSHAAANLMATFR